MRWILFWVIVLTGCEGERVSAAREDSGIDSAGTDSIVPDVSSGDGVPTDTPVTGECGDYRGAEMVRVGSYCIDTTEVTRGQFLAFVAAPAAERNAARPAECAWNTTGPSINGTFPDFPVDETNFCDAMTYCAWANKRLCGRIGGGANETADFADAAKSEWFAVCSVNGASTYPYGNTYSATRCFTQDGTTEETGSRRGCAGAEAPHSKVFDLSGNVFEWENSCTASPMSTTTRCRARGGGYGSGMGAKCAAEDLTNVDVRLPGFGFRCCKD